MPRGSSGYFNHPNDDDASCLDVLLRTVIGCVVNFVMVGCTVITVANSYICLLCEFAPKAVLFSGILKNNNP
jgi:hypothetical protein